eukprot:3311156-Amphidinium_carterae.1
MNRVISDTAEYGCYLYTQAAPALQVVVSLCCGQSTALQACVPLLKDFMTKMDTSVIGKKYNTGKAAKRVWSAG